MIVIDEAVGWENANSLPPIQEFLDRVGTVLFSFDDLVKANVEIEDENMIATFFAGNGVPLVEVFASAAEGAWHLYGTNMNPSCRSCSGGSCTIALEVGQDDK